MKKIITLSTALLLMLALSACDDVGKVSQQSNAEKTLSTVKTEESAATTNTPVVATEPIETAKPIETEKAKESSESVSISAEPSTDGKADYQKLSEWESFQAKKLGNLGMKIQQQVQQAMVNKTVPAGLEENIQQYRATLTEVGKSIESLALNDSEIKMLAMKKRDLYNLSGEGLLLTVEAMASQDHSEEVIREFEKRLSVISASINQLNAEITKMEEALNKKYLQ